MQLTSRLRFFIIRAHLDLRLWHVLCDRHGRNLGSCRIAFQSVPYASKPLMSASVSALPQDLIEAAPPFSNTLSPFAETILPSPFCKISFVTLHARCIGLQQPIAHHIMTWPRPWNILHLRPCRLHTHGSAFSQKLVQCRIIEDCFKVEAIACNALTQSMKFFWSPLIISTVLTRLGRSKRIDPRSSIRCSL